MCEVVRVEDTARFAMKVFDALETPFFILSYPDLRFISANRTALGDFVPLLLGRQVGEGDLPGQALDQVLPATEAAASFRSAVIRSGSGRTEARLEGFSLAGPGPQDETRYFNLVCVPLPAQDGDSNSIAVSVKDITCSYLLGDQENLLSKMKHSLEKRETLQSILNVLPLGVIFYSRDDVVNYVNESFFWLTGYDWHDLAGMSRVEAEKMLFRNGEAETGMCVLTRFNERKPVQIYQVPLVRMGSLDGTVVLVSQKTAELELILEKRIVTTVLDSIQSAVLVLDGELNVMACSKAVLEMLDLGRDEVVGLSLKELKSLVKAQQMEISYQTVRGRKFLHKLQVNITTRTQKNKTMLFNLTPVFSAVGAFAGTVAVGSDMTSFMEKQEKIIENERLAVIGQLTSSIAHEIKNPLTVISGFAEVSKSKILKINGNDSIKESMLYYQQEIIDNSRNMNRLIVDVLQLARPRKAEKSSTNLSGTLDKICNAINPYALQKNVTLIKNLIAADLELVVDPVEIGQVLLNLCNNAIQAMPDGGTLSISTDQFDGYLVIQVADTGHGIKSEDLSKLGSPFFTTKSDGTGLGLSVTYSIISDYGGKIEVESEVGRGTTFKVFLPLEKK